MCGPQTATSARHTAAETQIPAHGMNRSPFPSASRQPRSSHPLIGAPAQSIVPLASPVDGMDEYGSIARDQRAMRHMTKRCPASRPSGKLIMHTWITLLAVVALSSCSVSGKYRSEGPCQGFHVDPSACERAHDNALAVSRVQLGQSRSEVRAEMGRDPGRRTASSTSETWAYLTDYSNQIFTVFVFRNGNVVKISQAQARKINP